jgi:hypothetical protein
MAIREKSKQAAKGLTKKENGLSRREFFKTGAAAGVGAAVIAGGTSASAQTGTEWHYEYDVVVIGGGCTGLPAAIRARDLGASVLVVEQNFDNGGRMLHSGGQISMGGGDPLQLRDLAGESDREGFISVPAVHPDEELDEDVDHLFRDMVDWSIIDNSAQTPYRYNDRAPHRAWADHCYEVRQFLIDNYVRMGRISGTHGTGGMTRARRAVSFLMLGETTDIRAGTVTAEDAGGSGRSSHFAPSIMANSASVVGPGAVGNGTAMARPLEFSAREKGVHFMMNRHMDTIIREGHTSGAVLGVTAHHSPRFDPDTGEQLTSYWSNGNIDETRETINIRARKGVIIGSGGYSGNEKFRSMFYPGMNDPFYRSSGSALLGTNAMNGSGIIAGMAVGANMGGMLQSISYTPTFHVPNRMGTRDAYTPMAPGHPTFPFRRSTGATCSATTMQHLVAVNQVGKRFFHEQDLMRRHSHATFPGGSNMPEGRTGANGVQNDWRNCRISHVRSMYNKNHGFDAMIAMNEGSEGPEYYAGSHWVIFDQAAVARANINTSEPTFSRQNGYFFQADTIEELAAAIYTSDEQRVPLTHLADTIAQWNGYAAAGVDPDFERENDAPMHQVTEPPFYAALITPLWHDSYGGLKVNEHFQVVDFNDEPIPGLYAGGEASGSGNQHGLGRCPIHGYIAGTHAASR